MNQNNDLISRQAAIDLFPDDDLEYDTKGGYIAPHLARQMICELPSVQPNHVADIGEKADGDMISRRMAIDAMTNTLWHYPNECYRNLNEYEFAKGLAELGLKSVPSAQPDLSEYSDRLWESAYERGKAEAQPERKQGKWESTGWWGRIHKCSQCGNVLDFDGVNAGRGDANFCPNCGADMRDENNANN